MSSVLNEDLSKYRDADVLPSSAVFCSPGAELKSEIPVGSANFSSAFYTKYLFYIEY